jgi:hypothetical protein
MQAPNKILVGNKTDLAAQRKVSTEQGRQLADQVCKQTRIIIIK